MKTPALTIVAFGDSITHAAEQPENLRWVSRLNARFAREYPDRPVNVLNAGVGGNTSREGLARMAPAVLAYQPDIVLVEFGGNDATVEEHRHVSHEEYRNNLEIMRQKIVEDAKARMVLMTFPPVIDAWHAWGQHAFYRSQGGQDAYIGTYREITREWAREKNLLLIDIDRALREAISTGGAERYILPDGVHLTADGNDVVADTVFQALRRALDFTGNAKSHATQRPD